MDETENADTHSTKKLPLQIKTVWLRCSYGNCTCIAEWDAKMEFSILTGKKPPGGIGPPPIPSFGGIWAKGLGAGPAFCKDNV